MKDPCLFIFSPEDYALLGTSPEVWATECKMYRSDKRDMDYEEKRRKMRGIQPNN